MKIKKNIAVLLSMAMCAGFMPAQGAGLAENGIEAGIDGIISKTVTINGNLNITDDVSKIAVLVTNSDAKNFTDKENFVYIDQIDVKESGEYSLSFTDSGIDTSDYIINMNIEGRLLSQIYENPLIQPDMQITEDGKTIKNLDYITGDINATAEIGTPMNAMFICAQYKNGVLVHTQVSKCDETLQKGEIVSLPVEYKGSMDVDEIKLFFWDSVNFTPITKAKVVVSVTGGKTDYPWQWNTVQGVNNWYYCTFANNEATEAIYNADKKAWMSPTTSYSVITRNGGMLPGATYDVGMVFKAPFDGMVKMTAQTGEIKYSWGETYAQSDGVNLSIVRDGEDVLWSESMVYGDTPSYDVTTAVRAGQEIWFVANCNETSGYDDITWKPSLTYIGNYVGEEETDYTYYQKTDGELKELSYNTDNDLYVAQDGVDYINKYMLKQTGDTAFVKRYTVPKESRYRVTGNLVAKENGGSTLITIYKNSEIIWKQLVPEGENGEFDVRMRANEGDTLDVELSLASADGSNTSVWESKVVNVPGPVSQTNASTSQGDNFKVTSEYPLTSFIGEDVDAVYSVKKNGVKFPMSYADGKWSNDDVDKTAKLTKNTVTVTENDVVVEIKAPESGTVKISGNLKISGKSDGVLTKIYHEDSLLWSNRVGGERFVRWDEPYDVSYFLNEVNAVAQVKAGDTIIFTFNRWRLSTGDVLNLEDIMLSYIDGEVLSDTTKWKLSQCTLTRDLDNVNIDGLNVWEGDGFFVIYPGLSTFIGYPEISEIKAAIKGGELDV